MSRLTGKTTDRGGSRPPCDTFTGRENSVAPTPTGVVWPDGTFAPLDGQPPVAQSKGWGDLSWLHQRWR